MVAVVPYFRLRQEHNTRKGFLKDADYDKLAAACAKRGLYNIRNYADLVDAARKISEGRERIEQEALKFAKDTEITEDRTSFGENRTKAN